MKIYRRCYASSKSILLPIVDSSANGLWEEKKYRGSES